MARFNKTTIPFAIGSLLILLVGSCKDDPNGPIEDDNDPRKYTWTVDTLHYPNSFQTLMRKIWANSAKNVYTVGFNDQNKGKMWNFDGNRWNSVAITSSEGGIIQGAFDLESIYGFAANDIWAVGEQSRLNPNPPPNFLDSSLIIHFDGSQWREHQIQRGRSLVDVWGSSPSSVWAVGLAGTAYFFNGVSWGRRTIRDDINFNCLTGNSSSDIYALGYKLDTSPYDSIASYIFHFDGNTWSLRDSLIENTFPPQHTFGTSRIWALNSSEVFTTGYGIFRKSGVGWTKVYDDGSLFGGIDGNAPNNIFTVGSGGIYHFNGSDWFRYPQFSGLNSPVINVWTDGKEVFAVGNDGTVTFIYHGK